MSSFCIPRDRAVCSLGDFASQALVDARTNATCRLDSLWAEQAVVILFLRRLGCQLCRTTALEFSSARAQFSALGVSLVAISFEQFGTGSDADRSFEKGGYFKGPIYTISKDVYESLFGRKGLFNNFYGLTDISKTKLAQCTAAKVEGNFKGDGTLMGGQ
jgi:prostamide/prostaglandin F2alpha synthase